MNPQYHFDELMRLYDARRTANTHIRKQRIQEIYREIPEYKALDTAVPDIVADNVEAIINGDRNFAKDVKSRINSSDKRKAELLREHGYPEDYLDPIYTCRECHDTGYVGANRCQCFKKEFLNLLYSRSDLTGIVEKENFNTFNIEYYPDDYIDSSSDMTPRDNIKRVLNTCQEFIQNFDDNPGNMLIYGHSGVGKTFLTHCIAKELLDKGYSVIYLTSYQLFDILETKVFHSGELDDLSSSILSMLYTCDLLIIDDLGTEMINKFTEVQLFVCIQERLRNTCPTIISTNLSFDDINNNYSERIFSRLTGYYKLVKIIGSDIRIKKALSENGGKK